jgi:hypothetical protein
MLNLNEIWAIYVRFKRRVEHRMITQLSGNNNALIPVIQIISNLYHSASPASFLPFSGSILAKDKHSSLIYNAGT